MRAEGRCVPATSRRTDIRLAGSGGQGVILAGVILAEAALLAGNHAAQSQAYGPESRGGSSRSDVVVADDEIVFPRAEALDVLVALTSAACLECCADLRPGGLLLYDDRHPPGLPAGDWRPQPLPLAVTAKKAASSTLAANIVALGALGELTAIVPADALEDAVARRVPSRSREANLRALVAGRRLADRERCA